MPTIDASVGGVASNSYLTLAEANTYFASRLSLDPPWVTTGATAEALLIMATRVLDSMAVARKVLRFDGRGGPQGRPYYVTSRAWTGAVATATQALGWPRTGMFDRLGRAISENAIPNELKEATAELAGQLLAGDRTLDNPAVLQGISEVKAGSVQVKFAEMIQHAVLPGAVIALIPPSWLTDEVLTPAVEARFRAL